MTPAARHAAAIGILDLWLAGAPLEQALTNWGRQSRFAGSRDRRAVRDIVFDAVRRRRSALASGAPPGGAETGRAMVIGLLRLSGTDPGTLFSGEGYAPSALDPAEASGKAAPAPWPDPVRLDYPDWLDRPLKASLGRHFEAVMQALQARAPTFLRANARSGGGPVAIAALATEGIRAIPAKLGNNALEVTENGHKIQMSKAYLGGLVELQDAASQAVIERLELPKRGRILDYCCGGGGKALAMAALTEARVFAHDAAPARMRDLPARAERAGVAIRPLAAGDPGAAAPFDLVLVDAPCSGSGAWRRAPAGKWSLTPDGLARLTETQGAILRQAADLVAPGGRLGYVTCSILDRENADQIADFLAGRGDYRLEFQQSFTPLDGGDGMFVASLMRKS